MREKLASKLFFSGHAAAENRTLTWELRKSLCGETAFCMGHPSEQYDNYSSNIAVSISEYIIRDSVLDSSRNKQCNCARTP